VVTLAAFDVALSMRPMRILFLYTFLLLPLLAQNTPPPKTWVDPDTGHRVYRLTDEPNSASLYFNQNGYSADGKKLIYTTPDGLSTFDLQTHETRKVVEGRARVIVTGHKTQNVYYIKGSPGSGDQAVWATDVDTLVSREIARIPPHSSVSTVNADETLLAGTITEGQGGGIYGTQRPAAEGNNQTIALEQPRNKGQMMEQRLAAHLPMQLFVIDVKTGKLRTILKSTDWLNHLEFSPAHPNLLMFCHEGPWHKVDRIWTILTGGSNLNLVHKRRMAMEIAGHEFWSHDGSTIWYDLQTPRGQDFWLAGYNVDTDQRTWYHMQRNEWSIHFNVTRDGTLFCGDGGDPGQVAKAPDGEWIYLFRPEMIQGQGMLDDKDFVHAGVFHAEKLVNMSKHNYRLEPNVSFTPDQKWVVFRSNMFGPTYVFAVEVAKAEMGK
jgi:oligogalacturonide lyase